MNWKSRIVCASAVFVAAINAQTVTLRNVSFPGTGIEVGTTVEVRIAGGALFSSVTVVENFGAPYFFGTTDGNGDWSVTATEALGNVGPYNQSWYVDGLLMNPINLSPVYQPFAPGLPTFAVHNNSLINNCPIPSTANACSYADSALRWIWSPVTYDTASVSTADIPTAAFTAAANMWNGAQSKLQFSSSASTRQ